MEGTALLVSTKSPCRTSKPFPFLSLSGELRNLVYSFALADKHDNPSGWAASEAARVEEVANDVWAHLEWMMSAPDMPKSSAFVEREDLVSPYTPIERPVALLATCTQVYVEAAPYLFTCVSIDTLESLYDALSSFSPPTLAMVQYIHIDRGAFDQSDEKNNWLRKVRDLADLLLQVTNLVRISIVDDKVKISAKPWSWPYERDVLWALFDIAAKGIAYSSTKQETPVQNELWVAISGCLQRDYPELGVSDQLFANMVKYHQNRAASAAITGISEEWI